jgi:NADPH:quinone reductase-like Zn-dependent oxidoreductase
MTTMRAIQVHAYGDAAQLRLEEVSQPVPGEGKVLVRSRPRASMPSTGKCVRAF